jgi:hypothetical protein
MNYSKDTELNINLISCYFIDVYYNHLYQLAITKKNKNEFKTITDAYKNIIYDYKNSIERPDIIKNTINDIYDYHVHTTKKHIGFSVWYDNILKDFVPLALIDNLSSTNKSSIICKVIVDIIEKISINFVDCNLVYVIDDRSSQSVDYLIKTIMDIVVLIREKHFKNFIDPHNTGNVVPLEVALKLKEALLKYHKNNKELEKMINNMPTLIKHKNTIIDELTKKNNDLTNEINKLTFKSKTSNNENEINEINELKNMISNLSSTIKEIKSSPTNSTESNYISGLNKPNSTESNYIESNSISGLNKPNSLESNSISELYNEIPKNYVENNIKNMEDLLQTDVNNENLYEEIDRLEDDRHTTITNSYQPTFVEKTNQPTFVEKTNQPTFVEKTNQPTFVEKTNQPTFVEKTKEIDFDTVDFDFSTIG